MVRLFEKELEPSEFEELILDLFEWYLNDGVSFAPVSFSSKFYKHITREIRKYFRERAPNMEYIRAFKESLLRENYKLARKMWEILLKKKEAVLLEKLELYSVGERIGDIDPPKVTLNITRGDIVFGGSAGVLIKGESAWDVAKLYYENILIPSFSNETYKKLVETYTLMKDILKDRREDLAKKYKKIKERFAEFEDYNYEGKSFPSFPGILRENSIKLSLLPDREEFEKYYSVPPYGEGWDKERNVLLELLRHKDNERVIEFLKELHLQWLELEDYEKLFDSKERVMAEVSKLLREAVEREEIGESEVKGLGVEKKGRSDRKIVVEITPSKVNRVEEAWVILGSIGEEEFKGLEGFIAQLFANSCYLPKKVRIFKKIIKYNIRDESSRKRQSLEIVNLLKATFDSVIIYGMLKGEFSLSSPFNEFKRGYNLVFLNNIRKKSITSNTIFHDYYYHLLDGVEAMDHEFSEVHNMRARINVQNMKKYYYRTPKQKWISEEIGAILQKLGLEQVALYNFENGKIGIVARHQTGKGTIKYYGLEEVLSAAEGKDLNRSLQGIYRLLSTSESLLMAYSFKNTSTTGYSISVNGKKVMTNIYAISIINQSLESKGRQAKFIRIIRVVRYGLTEIGKNVRAQLIKHVAYKDNPLGDMKSSSNVVKMLDKLIKEYKKEGLVLLSIQNLKNHPREYESILKDTKNKDVLFFDMDSLVLDADKLHKERLKSALTSTNYDGVIADFNFGIKGKVFISKKSNEKITYRRPVMVFSLERELPEEEIYPLLTFEDEKGGASFVGIKRLFHTPYPDPVRRIMRPSLLLLGAKDNE
ncbi:hypothetical protein EP1X_06580 [Thermococcus sp. EP1]|uniref:hypothetical protein n=1 Tax=Thermococcus sp. EP1 TaxID=1591054 RepID=UPI0006D94267|nr:hypothetical protein [Thermococcus sp. EP1]KPU63017.1 hypothetical protein EP1X_06580 [Thermococcus sp. EP1]